MERFRREARTAAVLNHPHVLSVYDFGEDEGRCYLVMELVHGRSLRAELSGRGGPLEVDEACRYAGRAAAGLAAAHSAGVVHRDIEPGNLLLAEGGVKVADFGIARALDQAGAALTDTGQMLGTSAYLAPERGRVMTAAGPEADVYALGCALYELLCGQPPFLLRGRACRRRVSAHRCPPPPPRQLRAEIPAEVEALVQRVLAEDPAERPTATEVARHLAAVSMPAAYTASGPPRPTDPSALRPVSRRRRTRRTTVLTGAAAAAVIAAASAVAGHQVFNGGAEGPRRNTPRRLPLLPGPRPRRSGRTPGPPPRRRPDRGPRERCGRAEEGQEGGREEPETTGGRGKEGPGVTGG